MLPEGWGLASTWLVMNMGMKLTCFQRDGDEKKDYVTFLPEEWCEEEDDNEDEIGDRQ